LVRDDRTPAANLPVLALSALGVVFGDIGTSPLYTFKIVLAPTGGVRPDPAVTLGTSSLVIWTLIVVATIKYVSFAMRMDNHREGGILTLMALILIYGDGAITPVISVLSAIEGLNITTPAAQS
jgi:KUP system potassium uptake protein